MLQFKVQLNNTTNETEIIFQYGESRETLEEQVFETFVDKVENEGAAIELTRTIENGVVMVKMIAVAP